MSPFIALSIPGFSIQRHQRQPPTAIAALRGKPQPREEPSQRRKREWGRNKPPGASRPPPAPVPTPAGTAPTAGAAAGSGPGKGRAHLCGRSGRSSAGFPTEEKKGRGGQCRMSIPSAPLPVPSQAGRMQGRSLGALTPKWRDFAGAKHPRRSQRSPWGHAPRETLLNDPSPAFPKPASPGLAEAIAPGTEGTAKLKI